MRYRLLPDLAPLRASRGFGLLGVAELSYGVGPSLGQLRSGVVADLAGPRFSLVSGGLACTGILVLICGLLPSFVRYRAAGKTSVTSRLVIMQLPYAVSSWCALIEREGDCMHATPHSRFRAPWVIVAIAGLGVIALAAGVVHFAPSSCAQTAAEAGTGVAFHYNPLQAEDRCSIEPLNRDGLYASLPPGQYGDGADCGAYLTVTGPEGTVQAEVVDMCPGCAAGRLDLSTAAFSRIQPLADGTAPVSYQLTRDPALPGPLAVRIQPGSTSGSMAIQVLNHGNPLTQVQVNGRALSRRPDGYWVAHGGAGSGPFRVDVMDSLGHSAVLTGITFRPGALQRTTVLMYGPVSPQASTPAPSPAPAPATTAATAARRGSPAPTQPSASATC